MKEITTKELVDTCNSMDGNCDNCSMDMVDFCRKFVHTYDTVPFGCNMLYSNIVKVRIDDE